MAAEASTGVHIDVPSWLKSMPTAPEYHPTIAEFQDPIGYIFKIEKEASKYGICKIVPPLPAPSKKTTISNFTKSLSARSNSGPNFTTRHQQIGFCPRKHRPVKKPVWLSGEKYTLTDFETKAKFFEKNYLKKYAKKSPNPLEIETLYWNATLDKPFSVEYANDMPGSAFTVRKIGSKKNEASINVGDTDWNMREVSRVNVSLLRFMKEEIPGVTSPMVYVAMIFSWFAWHVEDHDFHSLNYLHMGSSKTWYGVPREAAFAFEEVIREHGYGGEINPLVTFATLGEKTTVMSPEVLLSSGVPCCRLVQNAGEFVVTFPRAYHSGFSHGFNIGEAANIATPEWLSIAKEAAIRRASINCPPMVSHFQLLYDLAISLCSRVPKSITDEPRSSRLKNKRKGVGETLIKEIFFQDMIQNNEMLHILRKGSPVVLLPQNYWEKIHEIKKGTDSSNDISYLTPRIMGQMNPEINKYSRLFSCVTCGILCFSCVAIVKPTKEASHYLISADYSSLDDLGIAASDSKATHVNSCSGTACKNTPTGLFDVPVRSSDQGQTLDDETLVVASNREEAGQDPSSLGLLAMAYGNSSDSEGEEDGADIPVEACKNECFENGESDVPLQISDSYTNSESLVEKFRHQMKTRFDNLNSTNVAHNSESRNSTDEDSSQLHVFCLEHAMQVEKQLSSIGGAHIFLVCHPEYPELESQAQEVAEELGNNCIWNDISFREATAEDDIKLQLALDNENAIHGNGDWAVKLGINLFYSANLSRSPLYCKQMPYNSVLYSAFGRSSQVESPSAKGEFEMKGLSRQKKIVVAGKWCGKVWMSNQAHPLLVNKDSEEQEEVTEIAPETSRSSRKRKGTARISSQMKEKLDEPPQVKSNRGGGSHRLKKKIPEVELLDESCEEFPVSNSWQKSKSKRKTECLKKVINESSDEFLIGNSWKQIKGKRRTKRIEKETTPDLKSLDESSEEFPLSNSWKKIKSKRKNECLNKDTNEAENLDESSEEILIGNSCKRRTKRIEKETTPDSKRSDESSEEIPLTSSWKKIKGKSRTKRIKKESSGSEHSNESSDEIQTTNSRKQIKSKNGVKETETNSLFEDGPSTRLRKRIIRPSKYSEPISSKPKPAPKKQQKDTKTNKDSIFKSEQKKYSIFKSDHQCEFEGCTMSFASKNELTLHRKNVCPVKGCGKKFFSHKYLIQHRRVHIDDRPLKCPWKGCKMSFKWAWARTEHIRVHTGARPYVCTESGCGQTFRFVSDFSRHKRKTGHTPKKARG